MGQESEKKDLTIFDAFHLAKMMQTMRELEAQVHMLQAEVNMLKLLVPNPGELGQDRVIGPNGDNVWVSQPMGTGTKIVYDVVSNECSSNSIKGFIGTDHMVRL